MPVTLTDTGRRQIRMIKPLGKGGFGAVYLAEVTTPEGLVQRMAVKVLHEEFADNEAVAARARDEARLMSQLNHDHVVKVHALTRIGGRAAVLMEYVEGIDCTALLDAASEAGERGLPLTVAAAITERAASALHAAWHDLSPQTGQPLRVVHRDIKPSNLLVSVAGVVKVMDFGVARADFEREAATESVQYGTHRYMAPERWLTGEAGPASDIYSLGVTFWELLTGERFERLPLVEGSYHARRDEQLARMVDLARLDARAGAEVQEVLSGMLAFDPERRLTAHEIEERLATLVDGADGPGLRRYARRVIPGLVRAREQRLARDSQVEQLTNSLVFTGGSRAAPPPAPADEGRSILLPALASMLLVVTLGGAVAWAVLGPAPQEAAAGDGEAPAPLAATAAEPSPVAGSAEPSTPAAEPSTPAAEPPRTDPVRSTPKRTEADRTEPVQAAPPRTEPVQDAPVAVAEATPAPEVVVKALPPPPTAPIAVQLLGSPVFDKARVGSQEVANFGTVQLTPGTHTIVFTFAGEDGEARCTVTVAEGDAKIKYDKRKGRCSIN